MSINSIGSTQAYQPQMNSSARSSSLSSDQKAFIEELLSQYDSESLSADDAKEIVKAMQEAGIEPSQAMASAMATSGFEAKEIGDLAGVGKGGGERPMGPPPPKEEEMSSISDLLESLLSSEEEDEYDVTTTSVSSSFDTVLDYTSKIVSLKDDAKAQVMDLLNKYNSQDNKLSQEDTQKFIVNSLSQILKESDNYNTMSFYA
ncbi:hypothetical protein SMGD1_2555 [Sulfurimonas gotlandica GD1]|uniref:Uncharacterized protein n=1 Tax=Sulfurimonas gotlandica (strain DSM 19862 / JCM 16533 / GD1) TaxID=929558 RepID=B6BNK4_SULGG|nr:hypothetical protein [Sulfurimonas gotlandica]EDZ61417.1 conserved hypothetical protein [Sulfurimonas gotlandica GD1]EHP31077.1 hypothetical protein SMGD1_2555 [Sulfurimonas gotlandica GD1]